MRTAPGGASRPPSPDDRPFRAIRAARTDPRLRSSGTIRLLVVEDDARDADALRAALAEARGVTFRVTQVDRLGDALDRLAAEPFDLVLLDLGLPDCQGIESCDRYLDVAPDVPFVVLTGVEDEEVGLEAVQRGAQDYLVKGAADGEVLGRALRYAVERHGMLADIARAFRDSRVSEQNFRGVLERSAEGLVVVDVDGVARYANRSALGLLGREEIEVVGAPWSSLVGTDATPATTPDDAVEATLVRPDGSRANVDVRRADVRWLGEHASLVSLVDLAGRRRAERIALAQCVQRSFLPECSDVVDGKLEVRACNELCQDVSGDVYDVIALDDGRWALAVGDVTGHGLAAALLMAKGRAFLRAFCRRATTPADVLFEMNGAMAGTNTEGRFLTLFLAFLDPRDGRLDWASAGHLPGLVRRATGAIEMLEATGPPLWIVADAAMEAGPPTTLECGDVLLLYSDGITEAAAQDGERYGLDRLVDDLARATATRPRRLVPALRERVREYTGPSLIHDDLTLLAASRCAGPADRNASLPEATLPDAPLPATS